MRILFVIHTWNPEGKGGTEQHARSLARTLSRKGHQIGVFTRTGRPDRPEYEVHTEWEGPTSITRINNCWREAPNFEWIYRNRSVHEAFSRELDSFKPDLVHVHHLTGLSVTLLEEVKLRALPLVFTLHDFWTVCPRGQRMTKDLELCETVERNKCYSCLAGLWPHMFDDRSRERTVLDQRGHLAPQVLAEWERYTSYSLNLCDVLIAPSDFHRERMLDFRIDAERLVALSHGLDHAPFDGRLRANSKPTRIGYIGSVIAVKGVHVLLKAFLQLGRQDCTLEIWGEMRSHHDDKDYETELRELAANAPNVHFHGAYEQEQVGHILDHIDILVVPSLWWESFCLTIREGLLAGIPVVASDIGAMREALDGERDGVLFRVGDADDLREKLEKLLNDDLYRERFYNRGGTVKSLEAYGEEVEALYAAAMRSSRRRRKTLKVAPPAFPTHALQHSQALSLPWDKVRVSMEQHGALTVHLKAGTASATQPEVLLNLDLHDGDRNLGNIKLRVNFAAIEDCASRGVEMAPPVPLPPPAAEQTAPSIPATAAAPERRPLAGSGTPGIRPTAAETPARPGVRREVVKRTPTPVRRVNIPRRPRGK